VAGPRSPTRVSRSSNPRNPWPAPSSGSRRYVLTTATLGPTPAPKSLTGARVVGKTTGFVVGAAGEVPRYRAQEEARSAPAGQKLIAFQMGYVSGDVTIAAQAHAELVIDGGARGRTYGFEPALLRLQLPGGQMLRPRNIAKGDLVYNVFTVPATFTCGRLRVAGSERVDGLNLQIVRTTSFQISIPAG
jgi:hypothetical protein